MSFGQNFVVSALKEIGNILRKKDWDFSKDPCSGDGNWSLPVTTKGSESSLSCDCSFDHNTTCHVVSLYVHLLILTFIYGLVYATTHTMYSSCLFFHVHSPKKLCGLIILMNCKFPTFSTQLKLVGFWDF